MGGLYCLCVRVSSSVKNHLCHAQAEPRNKDGAHLDDLAREAEFYLQQGYRTVKMKVGGLTPEADAERVHAVRQTVGNTVDIRLDANIPIAAGETEYTPFGLRTVCHQGPEHTTEPAQSTDFNNLSVGRSHRIAVDTLHDDKSGSGRGH